MKNIKNIIVYAAIIILIAAAAGGWLYSRYKANNAQEAATNIGTVTTGSASAESAGAEGSTAGNSNGAATESASSGSEESSSTALTESTSTASTDGTSSAATEGTSAAVKITPASAAGTAAAKPGKKTDPQSHIKQVMSRETEKLDPNPIVGVGQGADFAKDVETAVTNAGGLKGIVKKGDVVLIKPNIAIQSEGSGSPMITDYRVTQKVVDMVKALGASKVIIAEGNFSSNAFDNEANGYKKIKGVELYNINDCDKSDCYELKPQKSLTGKSIFVPKVFMDADVVINVAKLKTHFLTRVSLCLKNWIGVPSYKIYAGAGDKGGLHDLGIEQVIIDLNKIRKPDFCIIDGVIGGEGYGPYANTPVDSKVVFAGRDPVAMDTVGLTFMGVSLDDVSHVRLAADEKLGIDDLSKIKVKGADLNKIKMKFETY